MLLICDEQGGCNNNFEVDKIEVRNLEDGIEKNYFKCTHCNKEYLAFYTDKTIRIKQDKMRRLLGSKITSSITNRIDKLKIEIKKDMDNLKIKVEGTH